MQQAYRALRVVAEAQTIRIVLSANPGELMLDELCTACESFNTQISQGVKAVVLDFKSQGNTEGASPAKLAAVSAAVQAVAQPVLAVVRVSVSATASALIHIADMSLVAQDAVLTLPDGETLTGAQAARLGHVTWSVPAGDIERERERILAMLREKSAVALQHTKASVRQGAGMPLHIPAEHPRTSAERLAALERVDTLYLTQLMQTADAHEGLNAFLEKRKPQWKNQ